MVLGQLNQVENLEAEMNTLVLKEALAFARKPFAIDICFNNRDNFPDEFSEVKVIKCENNLYIIGESHYRYNIAKVKDTDCFIAYEINQVSDVYADLIRRIDNLPNSSVLVLSVDIDTKYKLLNAIYDVFGLIRIFNLHNLQFELLIRVIEDKANLIFKLHTNSFSARICDFSFSLQIDNASKSYYLIKVPFYFIEKALYNLNEFKIIVDNSFTYPVLYEKIQSDVEYFIVFK